MELTTRGRYAVMAMADLAAHASELAVPLSQIAERQNLSLAYLEQLFLPLRRAGLVESARGRAGGYRLAHRPEDISVAAVMAAVAEDTRFTRCSDDNPGCARDKPCLTHELWTALGQTTIAFLNSVSLADVVSGKRLGAACAEKAVAPLSAAPVYLDYNATAPLVAEARSAMVAAMTCAGNPSSVHAAGRRSREIVESARESVARLVGARPSEVVFTSGASEANAWIMAQPWAAIAMAEVEHESVLAPARANGAPVQPLAVDQSGRVLVDGPAFGPASGTDGRPLLALQLANNETGVIQDLPGAVAVAREQGVFVHCDAVQAVGRIAVDFAALGVDTMSVSAHKFGGPKGIGALIVRDRIDLKPLIRGGGQERRRRAGTENVAAIAGFGAAAEAARRALGRIGAVAHLRDRLEAAVRAVTPDVVIIGSDAERLANTSCLALPGKHAETLVIRLDLAGICVSAGSACSSGKVGASHALTAMGLSRDIAQSAIRVSLGPETSEDDVARFIATWKEIAGSPALAA